MNSTGHQYAPDAGDALTGAPFIAILNDLEAELPIRRFRVGGFNYWPIMRFLLNAARAAGQPIVLKLRLISPSSLPQQRLTNGQVGETLWYLRDRIRERRRPDPFAAVDFGTLGPAEALFLNRERQYIALEDGRLIQPHTDRLRLLVEDLASCMTLSTAPAKGSGEMVVPARDLPPIPAHLPLRLRDPQTYTERRACARVLSHAARVNERLRQRAPMLGIDAETLLHRIEQAVRQRAYFNALLSAIRPRAVFLSSFSGAYHVCAAAKPLGITVVDVQHGGMHAHHPLAAHWSNRPRKGYELLPDLFWSWTSSTARSVGAGPRHPAIVGGNPSLAFLRHQRKATPVAPRPGHRPVVLFALQYGRAPLVADHVLAAYRATQEAVDWRFRLHPAGRDRLPAAATLLGLPEEVIVRESHRPLSDALEEADLLLTNTSTIVREAIEYGLPAAVCTREGAALHDDLVSDGAVAHLRTQDEVAAAAKRAGDIRRETVLPDFSDPELVRRTFHSVLKGTVP